MYGTGAGLINGPFCINLFVGLSVIFISPLLVGTLFSFPLCLFCCCVGLNVFIFSIKFIVSFDFKPSLGRELEGIFN